MFQYKYSDLIAGVVTSSDTARIHSSRFIGIPDSTVSSSNNIQSNNSSLFSHFVSLSIVLIVGTGLGLTMGFIAFRKQHIKN